ncbi:MAG: ABC transporter permease [Bacteroidota bacterium]
MNQMYLDLSRGLSGEMVKMKRGVLPWMILLGGPITALMYFSLYLLAGDHYIPAAGENPWEKFVTIVYSTMAYAFVPLFLLVMASSANYLEHKSRAFDYLYTLPIKRGYFFLSKIMILLLGLIVYFLLLGLFVFLSGMLLSLIRPEFTFQLYSPDWSQIFHSSAHYLLLFLGVTVIQCWLSFRLKNVIIPIVIGLACFGIGLVLYFFIADIKGESTAATLFPYSLPFYSLDLDSKMGVVSYGGIPNIYLYSILFLFIVTCLGFYTEERREVR